MPGTISAFFSVTSDFVQSRTCVQAILFFFLEPCHNLESCPFGAPRTAFVAKPPPPPPARPLNAKL